MNTTSGQIKRFLQVCFILFVAYIIINILSRGSSPTTNNSTTASSAISENSAAPQRRTEDDSATAPTPLVRAHILTPEEVEAAERDFVQRVNTLSSTNKEGEGEESGRLDAETLANVAKQYEYLQSADWWPFWFIKTYRDEEGLAKKIALRRYGNDEVKVDPYVDSFVERYKTIMDDGRSEFAKQEFAKLKFFINQPVTVWDSYYGPSVSDGRYHHWKTDRFDLNARTYAGKVEEVSVKPVAGLAYFSADEITALGNSLGLGIFPTLAGCSAENGQLYASVDRMLSGVTIGTPQSRKRSLMGWGDGWTAEDQAAFADALEQRVNEEERNEPRDKHVPSRAERRQIVRDAVEDLQGAINEELSDED